MKKKRKFLLSSLILTLILAMAVVFSGCGGPQTLEEFVNSDSEAQEFIESQSTDGMKVDIKENTVNFTYTDTDTFEGEQLDMMKEALDKEMKNQDSAFTSIADTLEEESGIDEITIKVVYRDGAGTELWSGEFK